MPTNLDELREVFVEALNERPTRRHSMDYALFKVGQFAYTRGWKDRDESEENNSSEGSFNDTQIS